jgi:hypothetical protein
MEAALFDLKREVEADFAAKPDLKRNIQDNPLPRGRLL